jgi:hypothetical protein
MMNDKVWLDKVVLAATAYNDQRMHTNFQEEEILKFLAYLHQQYGYEYEKPAARHRNEPWKMGA